MPEAIEPKREYHNFSRKKILVVAGVLVVLAPLFFLFYFNFAINRPAQGAKEALFEIDRGEGTYSISERLYSRGLINSKVLFNLYILITNKQTSLQAGSYKVPAGYSVRELVELFQKGRDDKTVTFLEGWRVEEIAREASSKFENVGYEQFIEKAKAYEGYLFPDTYEFSSSASEDDILERLRENFDLKTASVLSQENLLSIGLTKSEVVILASIVEREVVSEEDRRYVSGILTRRYKNGELLGADATTQYTVSLYKICAPDTPISCFYNKYDYGVGSDIGALCDFVPSYISAIEKCISTYAGLSDDTKNSADWWPSVLTFDDLSFPSPYNTRKNTGLPPSPISNPSLNSINSVINQIPSDYNYYLTDEEGVTRYAKTLTEHNENVARYL